MHAKYTSLPLKEQIIMYLEIKSKSFLDPIDVQQLKELTSHFNKRHLDITFLDIEEYKLSKRNYLNKLLRSRKFSQLLRS